jgi:hypothetical protein
MCVALDALKSRESQGQSDNRWPSIGKINASIIYEEATGSLCRRFLLRGMAVVAAERYSSFKMSYGQEEVDLLSTVRFGCALVEYTFVQRATRCA